MFNQVGSHPIKTNDEGLKSTFDNLYESLKGHYYWQKRKFDLYNAKRKAPTLNISLSEEVDRKIPASLDWGRIAVDHAADKLQYDLIKNDQWGVNKLLFGANIDAILDSAIRCSMVAACSFVSVMQGNMTIGEPEIVLNAYTGKEATGIYSSGTNSLEAGLVVTGYENKVASKFRLFLRSGIFDVDNLGNVEMIQEGTGLVQLVPFVFKQDLAFQPFGEARVTNGATENFDEALRTLKRMIVSSENYSNPQRVISIITAAAEEGRDKFLNIEEKLARINSYLHIEGPAEDIKTTEFTAQGPGNLISAFGTSATQFAAAMSMEPSDFGFEPSNGSHSAEAIRARKEKLERLISKEQVSYGQSIKMIAKIALLLRDGEVDPQFHNCEVRWLRSVNVADFGAIGDSLGKIQEMTPETRDHEFVLDKLGISMRGIVEDNGTLNRSVANRRISTVVNELSKARSAEVVDHAVQDPKNLPPVS